MNSISWMIYAADVVDKMVPLFGIAAFGFLCLTILFGVASLPENTKDACYPRPLKMAKRMIVVTFLFAFAAIFTPSASTVYMVAASEAGEQIIKTPEAREMFDVLRQRIMEELKVESK